jgi:hypothetical protein
MPTIRFAIAPAARPIERVAVQLSALSDSFSAAINAAKTETGVLLVVAAFVLLILAGMAYKACHRGFTFNATFRPLMEHKRKRRRRNAKRP